jgi:hypothetical protein
MIVVEKVSRTYGYDFPDVFVLRPNSMQYCGIYYFKRGYQTRSNSVKDENGDLLADHHIAVNNLVKFWHVPPSESICQFLRRPADSYTILIKWKMRRVSDEK